MGVCTPSQVTLEVEEPPYTHHQEGTFSVTPPPKKTLFLFTSFGCDLVAGHWKGEGRGAGRGEGLFMCGRESVDVQMWKVQGVGAGGRELTSQSESESESPVALESPESPASSVLSGCGYPRPIQPPGPEGTRVCVRAESVAQRRFRARWGLRRPPGEGGDALPARGHQSWSANPICLDPPRRKAPQGWMRVNHRSGQLARSPGMLTGYERPPCLSLRLG